jgi:PAS domain S-box-containing protein
MDKKLDVLIVEDRQPDAELTVKLLEAAGYSVRYERVETAEEFSKSLEGSSWDLILSDFSMPCLTIEEVLEIYNAHGEPIPIIVISGAIGEEKAVQLIKAGVNDYLLKNNMTRFIAVVERELREAMNRRELRSLNRELVKSEEKYRSYIDHAPDGVFIANETGKFTEVNEAACRITGYRQEELLIRSISDILPAETRAESHAQFARLVTTGSLKTDIPYNHKNGDKRWLTIDAVKITETRFLVFAIDITKRKKTEDELIETSARLGLATRAAGVGVWDLDLITQKLVWDDRMFDICGVAREDFGFSYADWQGMIHADDRSRYDAEVGMSITGEKDFDSAFRICLPDGSIRHIRSNAVVLKDASGMPFRSIGANWDITEQNRLQEKLTSSESNFRFFFETMNDMIFVGDTAGKIIYVNESVSTNLGYTRKELEDMYILDIHVTSDRDEATKTLTEMFAGNRSVCPLPLQRKDGSVLSVETHAWMGRWNGSDCVFGLSKDLSEVEEALQKFHKIFDNNPALIAITTIPDQRFSNVNHAFLAKTGFSKEEILGKTAEDLGLFIKPDSQVEASAALQEHGTISNLELQIRTKSGKILDGLFSGEIIESQGKKFFMTVMIDITLMKQAERYS